MKRLIAIFALLFATSALAVDNPIDCTGPAGACKISIWPHNTTGAKAATISVGLQGATTVPLVGIGTTSPDAPLSVLGSFGAAGQNGVGLTVVGLGSNGSMMSFEQSAVTAWGMGAIAGQSRFSLFNNRFPSTAGTEVVSVLSGGNVGIGSTNPQSILDIEQSIATGQGTTLRLGNTSTGQNLDIYGGSGNNSPSVRVRSNDDLLFFTNDTERMRVKADGSLKLSYGAANGSVSVLYSLNPVASQTCTVTCGVEPAGLNANSGTCLAGWNSAGAVVGCASAAASNF